MTNDYSQLAQISADRERIRNQLIDALGRKPTEQEIDQVLMAQQQPASGSLQPAPATPFQQ